MSLTLSDLKLGYKNQCTLNLPQLELIEGGINCIIGPNGCGKSTLLRGLSNLLPPLSGEIRLDGKPISEWNRKALAQKLTVLPQDPQPPAGISLEQLVMQGRSPIRACWARVQNKISKHVTGQWHLPLPTT